MLCDWPEAKRVQAEFRARANSENVANNSPDAGRRTLKWLYGAGMIVALDLEGNRPAIADIDNTGVFFAGFHQNIGPGRGKFFQFFLRTFIGAMVAPHNGENAQLGEIWFATEDFFDARELLGRQAMFRYQFWSDNWINGRHFAAHRQVKLMNSPTRSTTQTEN